MSGYCHRMIGLFLLMILAIACAGRGAGTTTTRPRVVVLPFESLSGNVEGSRIVTRLMQNVLGAHEDVQLVDPGLVEDALATLRIRQPSLMTASNRLALRQKVEFDLAVVGSVLSFGTTNHPYAGQVAIVSFTARVLKASDGVTVWADTRSKQGSDSQWLFGLGSKHDPALLADEMCRSVAHDIRWREF